MTEKLYPVKFLHPSVKEGAKLETDMGSISKAHYNPFLPSSSEKKIYMVIFFIRIFH